MPSNDKSVEKIKKFKEFLEKSLKRNVLEYTCESLTASGDNYGSIMQSIDVKVAKDDILHLVTKTPVDNPYLIEVFQPALAFVKEAHFYTDIVPTIEQYECHFNVPQNEKIDAFFRCFGSRISLDPSAKQADFDAIVMFENIKSSNYTNGDRSAGFDYDTVREVLKQLAKMHSLCIAIRRSQPDLFNSRVEPFLEPIVTMDNSGATEFENSLRKDIRYIEGLDTELYDMIEEIIKDSFERAKHRQDVVDTPYTTVVHRDLWSNNIMIKRDDTAAKSLRIKIYDYQLYYYESFAHDLLFCLCMTPNSKIIVKEFKSFVKYYHSEFIKSLRLVKFPLEDYTFEKMWDEIKRTAKLELAHIIIMNKVVPVDKSEVCDVDIDSFSHDIYTKNDKPSNSILKRWKLAIDVFTENGFL